MTDPLAGVDELDSLLDGLIAFVDGYVLPLEEKHREMFENPRRLYGEDGAFNPTVLELKREVRMRAAADGYYTMCVPVELGGGGQGPLLHYLAWERLHHRYGPKYHLPFDVIAHWARGPSHLFLDASPKLRDTVLPKLMSGESSMCFSLSEPDAGSDAWNLRTSATAEESGGWRLNGTKQWSTNGPSADYAVVFAVTDAAAVRARDGGVTAFVVPSDSAGFRVDSVIQLFGQPGGDEAIISLDEVRVSSDDVLGAVGNGFALALSGISLGRMFNAGRAVGMSRWAIERATEYAATRVTFGKPIAEYQAVQILLANSAMRTHAARCMALSTAHKLERGDRVRKELAMVKAFTTEASFQTLDDCMQVLGGMGFTNEIGLSEAWQVARISRVADGSAEIMRRTIARQLLRGDFAV